MAVAERPATARSDGPLRGTALVVGPLPPPYMGPAIGTQVVRRAFEAGGAQVAHLNTQDSRGLGQIGAFDLRNAWLALVHSARFLRMAAREEIDVVYIPISSGRWGYLRDAVLMAAARAMRKPVAVHLRGSVFQRFYREGGRLDRALIRTTMRWTELAIVLTPRLIDQFEGLVPPTRVKVLENAIVDPWPGGIEEVTAARETRWRQDPGALRLLFISNAIAAKGGLTAVRALSMPGMERAVLHVVGEGRGNDLAEINRVASEGGVSDRVRLLGALMGAEKFAQFEWADVLVHPTQNDGQPIVLLEAMAAGLPMIGSDIGGVPETIGDAGFIVPPKDPARLAERLATLAGDLELRVSLARAARDRYLARYTPEAYAERFNAVFSEILTNGDRAGAGPRR